MRMKLGELLLKAGVLQEPQLQAALAEQRRWGGRLGQILIRMGYLSEDLLVKALARQLGMPRVDLARTPPTAEALARVRPALVQRHGVLPLALREDGTVLAVAMADPLDLEAVDAVKATTGCRRIEVHLAQESVIQRHIGHHYGRGADLSPEAGDGAGGLDVEGNAALQPEPDFQAMPVAVEPNAEAEADDPRALLHRIEERQRKEVAVLRTLVELLIERGVLDREEYLARLADRVKP